MENHITPAEIEEYCRATTDAIGKADSILPAPTATRYTAWSPYTEDVFFSEDLEEIAHLTGTEVSDIKALLCQSKPDSLNGYRFMIEPTALQQWYKPISLNRRITSTGVSLVFVALGAFIVSYERIKSTLLRR